MSWKTVNEILGLAAADPEFCQELQKNPLVAVHVRGFELTAKEQEVFSQIHTNDLALFSQQVLEMLGPDDD